MTKKVSGKIGKARGLVGALFDENNYLLVVGGDSLAEGLTSISKGTLENGTPYYLVDIDTSTGIYRDEESIAAALGIPQTSVRYHDAEEENQYLLQLAGEKLENVVATAFPQE